MYLSCHKNHHKGFKTIVTISFELFGTNCQVSNNAKFLNAIAIIYESIILQN